MGFTANPGHRGCLFLHIYVHNFLKQVGIEIQKHRISGSEVMSENVKKHLKFL